MNAAAQVIAWHEGVAITRARFARDVHAVAARLPAGDSIVNRCVGRYAFAVAFTAAAMQARRNLLPGSTAFGGLEHLAREYGQPPVIDDAFVAAHTAALPDAAAKSAPRDPALLCAATARVIAVAFTSGSTGEPQPHPKTWEALASTARAVALRLDGERALNLVATVPPQHMYGLEASVMLAVAAGCAFHDGAAFHPDEVRAALDSLPRPRLLVTTPFHLRHLLGLQRRADEVVIDVILSATAPLPRPLAAAAETVFGARLHEIYGCTEAGTIATRRTTHDDRWSPVPGVMIEERDGRATVFAPYLSAPVVLNDRLRVAPDGRFELLGRDTDLIKVAGKRASLSDLTRKVCAVPGVIDAIVFMPDEHEHARPAALVVAPGVREDAVRAHLRERMDPAFVPRPLRIVSSLPRNALGKLARDELLRLLDAVPEERHAARVVDAAHPAIAGHFPGHPLVPGVMILAAVAEAVLGDASRVRLIRSVKFHRPLLPGEPFDIFWSVRDATARFRCERAGELIADGRLATE